MVTHPSTNRARRRVTSLIRPTSLPTTPNRDVRLLCVQVVQLTHMLNALLDGNESISAQMVPAYFLLALTWSLGAGLLEDGRVKFDQYIKHISAVMLIEPSVAPAGPGQCSLLHLLLLFTH